MEIIELLLADPDGPPLCYTNIAQNSFFFVCQFTLHLFSVPIAISNTQLRHNNMPQGAWGGGGGTLHVRILELSGFGPQRSIVRSLQGELEELDSKTTERQNQEQPDVHYALLQNPCLF